MAQDVAIGIDLGGTKALAGVVTSDGTVLARVWMPSHDLRDQPDQLLDRLADGAAEAAQQVGLSLAEVRAVGVCVPGPLDRGRSVVSVAPNLGWHNLAARPELERRMPGVAVYLENDVRAAALGEHALGAGKGYRSMLAVFVGSGVGGGLVIDGEVYHGAHGAAGEIGHTVVRAGGPRCPCGRSGCLEAMAARTGTARWIAQRVAAGEQTVLTEMLHGDVPSMTSRDLAQAIAQLDHLALRAARRSARYTGLGIGSALNLLDPDIVVIGGGIAEALGEQYVIWAGEMARRQALPGPARTTPVVASRLGDDAGLLGAALTAFHGLAAASATTS